MPYDPVAEEAHRAALSVQMHQLADTLPEALDALRWSADTTYASDRYNPRIRLRREDGAEIGIGEHRLSKGRLTLSGWLPDNTAYYERHGLSGGQITVSRKKKAWQIAHDIRERLIPDLDTAMAEVHRRQLTHAQDAAAVQATAALLLTVDNVHGNEPTAEDRRRGADTRRELRWGREPYGAPSARARISSYPQTNVTIKCENLTPEQARAVLAALQSTQRATAPAQT
ncbi:MULTISPECIES: hypothetical protein [Streptacidiphilus]|uniref:Integrase n=1 Tax=Streptacidiphilus cavernicola TaxID=3342716 RepID=A0ABV6UWG1_9ACTN|nr:hypothetical protein [Streptacidiphilus jeojiense]